LALPGSFPAVADPLRLGRWLNVCGCGRSMMTRDGGWCGSSAGAAGRWGYRSPGPLQSRFCQVDEAVDAGCEDVVLAARRAADREGRGEVGVAARLMTVKPKITVADPGAELRWVSRLPGIISGEHRFTLTRRTAAPGWSKARPSAAS
jgi:hypothetical protein